MDRIPMTREGYEKLRAELEQREKEMTEITRRVAAARELGDLSENAEYHAAREDQGQQQARIDQLKDKLARAYFVDVNGLPKDTVVFGARVRVKDLELDEEESFELVGPGEEDADKNRILTTSPVGQGLLGQGFDSGHLQSNLVLFVVVLQSLWFATTSRARGLGDAAARGRSRAP